MELFVSSGRELHAYGDSVMRSTALDGAGALCAGTSRVYCAVDSDHVIWQLDREKLMPLSVGQGGPGIGDMCLSGDEQKLCVLLRDADSIMLCDAATGEPSAVHRCGCNPQRLRLQEGLLVASGGESGCVHLYDPHTLTLENEISMPGPVCDALLVRRTAFALCMTQTLSSLLVAKHLRGGSFSLALEGMPGCLLACEGALLAATQNWLYAISPDGRRVLARERAPGCASRLAAMGTRLVLLDPLGERLYERCARGGWRLLGKRARDIALG